MRPHRRVCWVIPPGHNAEFVAAMEDVLEVYHRPYNPARPVICMDEQPTQLIEETRKAIPASSGRPERVDYEYARRGVAENFMFTEPLAGWRKVDVRERRTAVDWAQEIEQMLNLDYPAAEKVIMVFDNLNTHKTASLYEAFPPEKARALAERLEIHYTPKHGSWLNVAECELSAFTKQCLDRRIPSVQILQTEARAWYQQRNASQKSVNWQFTTEDARIKLKRLYPEIRC